MKAIVFGAVLIVSPDFSAGAPSAQQIEGLVNIRFQADARVYAIMAAINVVGFDLDAERLQANPTRSLVRERIGSTLEPGLKERLRDFYQQRASGEDKVKIQGDFISLALHLSGPPRFTVTSPAGDLPPDIQPFVGFERLVEELWQQGELARLWEQVGKMYVGQIEAYRAGIRSMILQTLRYMHTDARVALDRQVIFIPDLLGSYGSVNARNLDSTYIIVVGPSTNSAGLMRGVRHEYLHFLIDPLLTKYRSRAPDGEPFMKKAREQPKVRELYARDFDLMLVESLLRTVELRLDSNSSVQDQMALLELYDQGLIVAPYFLENLNRFEANDEPLQDFFPKLIEKLEWNTESKRGSAMEALRKSIAANQAELRKADEQREEGRAAQRDLLHKANASLQNRDWDKAKELLQAVLAGDEKNSNALFGLGQIALQEDDLGGALALFDQVVANAGTEAWIVAWSLIHKGRIYAVQGDDEKAKVEWNKVLTLQGDLRGAADAAKKALARP